MKQSALRIGVLFISWLGAMGCSSGGDPSSIADEDVGETSLAVDTPSTPRSGWGPGFFASDAGWQCSSDSAPSVVTGMACKDLPGCSWVNLSCLEVPGRITDQFWTPFFDDGSSVNFGGCGPDYWVVGVDCGGNGGPNCDRFRVKCAKIDGNTWTLSPTSPTFSKTLTASQDQFGGFAQRVTCDRGFPGCGQITATGAFPQTTSGGQPRTSTNTTNFMNGDFNPDFVGEWDYGFYKATCPVDMRVLGVSVDAGLPDGNRLRDGRAKGLYCETNNTPRSISFLGYPSSPENETVKLPVMGDNRRGQRLVNNKLDWADGFRKLECALGEYVSGVSQSQGGAVDAVRCSRAINLNVNTCHNVEFEHSDGGFQTGMFDWDPGSYKGRCSASEYMAGLSVNPDTQKPHSLLCCPK